MQWWPSGIEQNEDGVVRELPQRHVWQSSIWVTQEGVARRKWWNAVQRRWHWDTHPLPFIVADGRAGIHAPGWMSIERAIAMAWRLRIPESVHSIDEVVRVQLADAVDDASSVDGGLSASTLRWAEEEEEEEEEGSLPKETWKPLRWRVGAVLVTKGYSISNLGRLRDLRRRVTRGAWVFGRRWASVPLAGLVDLYEAAGIDGGIPLPLSIRQARGAILANATPSDLVRATGIHETTAWSYFCRAAVHVDGATLRLRVRSLVDPLLWEAVQRLRGQAVLGGSLSDLWDVVAPRLTPQLRRDAHVMSMLRLTRTSAILPF